MTGPFETLMISPDVRAAHTIGLNFRTYTTIYSLMSWYQFKLWQLLKNLGEGKMPSWEIK